MPLAQRASKKFKNFDFGVSFKMGDDRERFRDALNVFSNQGRLETRFGRARLSETPLPASVNSLSYFEDSSGAGQLLAKLANGNFVKVPFSGSYTTLAMGFSVGEKHRGVTWARGSSSRHIIALGPDGLWQFNGTEFTGLGHIPPGAPTIATSGTGLTGTFKVGLTLYSTATGFETNMSALSGASAALSNQGLAVTIPAISLNNSTLDKVRIYLFKVGELESYYVGEVNFGTSSFNITGPATSTQVPPTTHAAPLSGGGKYITEFNRQLVYAGNSNFPNDVYFSEPDLPDAFNDGAGRLVLYATLDGNITGLATGLYNNSVLDPFLVVFKRRSTHIYSEIGGEGRFVPISSEIGCVSHDTITVKNGVVYFFSEQGARAIVNGQVVEDKQRNPATLADDDISDIFRSPGYQYEINQSQLANSFSVYYSTLDQYMTWVAEGADNDFTKTYVYEFKNGGFKPYRFLTPATAACVGVEGSNETVFMADASGTIYKHSTAQGRYDEDEAGDAQPYEAFAYLNWLDGDDMDASFNFREIILRRLAGTGDVTVKVWVNYDVDPTREIAFENALGGFILDVSKLDVDPFGSTERSLITSRADINRVGENIMVGFYQKAMNVNVALVSAQLDLSKNGNRN